MKNFTGKALSWTIAGGTVELRLDRAPCNEIGSATLAELEQFVTPSRVQVKTLARSLFPVRVPRVSVPAPTSASFSSVRRPWCNGSVWRGSAISSSASIV